MKNNESNELLTWLACLAVCLLLWASGCGNCDAQSLKTYTVYPGNTAPSPQIPSNIGKVGDTLGFPFVLTKDYEKLAKDTSDNSSQKIAGVSDFFQVNSIRLAVRRGTGKPKPGMIAVNYYHKNSRYYYPALLDSLNKPLLLFYDTIYFCRILKAATGWKIEIYKDNQLLSTGLAPITIGLLGRKRLGIWIEMGSRKCPYEIRTRVGL